MMTSHIAELLLVSFLHVFFHGSESRGNISLVALHCRHIPAKSVGNTAIEYAYICLTIGNHLNRRAFPTGLAKYCKDDRPFSPQKKLTRTTNRAYCIKLVKACKHGNCTSVEHILSERDEEMKCQSVKTGMIPISFAARYGHLNIFRMLFRKGWALLAVDKKNCTLLHIACKGGNVEIVQQLLRSGKYDKERKGCRDQTPLLTAVLYNRVDVFDMLVNEGCNVSAVDTRKYNALHIASIGGNVEMMKHILSKGILDIDAIDGWKSTPIMTAAMYRHKDVFEILLNRGCSLEGVDVDSNNILHLACCGGDEDIVNRILETKLFDINCKGFNGRTPVLTAAEYGHKNVIKLLCSKDCNLKAVDNRHDTILHLACERGHVDVVKYIISLGVLEWGQKNYLGKTPLQLANETVYPHLEALLSKGSLFSE